MAIADFLVGSFCIPFYIPYRSEVPFSLSRLPSPRLRSSLNQSWPFGRFFCRIWVSDGVDDGGRGISLSVTVE